MTIGSGHKHYAVVRVEKDQNTVDTSATLPLDGLTPVPTAEAAHIVCRIELEPTIAANKLYNYRFVDIHFVQIIIIN